MSIFAAYLNWHYFELTFNFWNRKNSAKDRSGCRVVVEPLEFNFSGQTSGQRVPCVHDCPVLYRRSS